MDHVNNVPLSAICPCRQSREAADTTDRHGQRPYKLSDLQFHRHDSAGSAELENARLAALPSNRAGSAAAPSGQTPTLTGRATRGNLRAVFRCSQGEQVTHVIAGFEYRQARYQRAGRLIR